MVKKSFKLLIIILLTTSAGVYAADFPALVSACSIQNTLAGDTIPAGKGKAKTTAKPKKYKTTITGKKVTFENFDQQYERAMRYYNNQQFLSAAGIFEDLYPLSLGTPRADTILFLFAHSYYMNGDYEMAAFHFRDYVRRYPNSERTEDAFYYGTSAIYKTSPDYSLDQSNTEYAIEQIKAFIQAYPNNAHIEECNTMLDALRLKLARKDLEILILYYNTDHYEACQIAAKNFFNDYAYSPLMPEAIYYLVLNNYEYARKSVVRKQEERYKACLDACNRMLLNYEETKYTKEVEKISKDVQKQLLKFNKNSQNN